MLLIHLGEDEVIPAKEILAIMDYVSFTASALAKGFLSLQQEHNSLTSLGESVPKSVVITDRQVYLSPLSAATLKKRAEDKGIFEQSWSFK
ncbi:extracellular matrix regulator RemB [Fictibacillus iocasae]|uniref:Extracellular matrix regulator RemB n=1 Tax=Fictibacillus iocasae TaxID=2715437 RepID=A0ABW2NNC7_9BACL